MNGRLDVALRLRALARRLVERELGVRRDDRPVDVGGDLLDVRDPRLAGDVVRRERADERCRSSRASTAATSPAGRAASARARRGGPRGSPPRSPRRAACAARSARQRGLRDQRDVGLARPPRRVALGVELDCASPASFMRASRAGRSRLAAISSTSAASGASPAPRRTRGRRRAGLERQHARELRWGRPRAARRRRSASAASSR